MAHRLLRRKGWTVNHKRVHRLWREEGLQRPTPRKQKRARPTDGSVWGLTWGLLKNDWRARLSSVEEQG
jgi:transposase InsO family protein